MRVAATLSRAQDGLDHCINGGGAGVSIWTVYCFADGLMNGFNLDRPMFVTYADLDLA